MSRPNVLRRLLRGAALGAACLALLSSASCRNATQIVLRVHTNMPCTSDTEWQGVAVYVGKPGRGVEEASPTLVTTTCDESGSVGSLVVVPSDEKDDEVGLRIVAGVSRNPEKCAEAGYEDCIVARRALRFTPHDSLELDVELARDCLSVACDPERSCFRGDCVASETIALTPEPAPEVEGASVYCGAGVRCPTTGNVCCLHVDPNSDTAQGDCRPPGKCSPDDIVLNCDDDSDCPAVDPETGVAGLCALSVEVPQGGDPWTPEKVNGSACRFQYVGSVATHWALGLCQTRQECANGAYDCGGSHGVSKNPLPGYFWCEITVGDRPPTE